MFIARRYKLVLSKFFFNRVTPIWNTLPNYTGFLVDRMSVFKHKLPDLI